MTILDGKTTSEKILGQLKTDIFGLQTPPSLHIILVGDDPASLQYVDKKQKKSEEIGIKFNLHHLPVTTSTDEVVKLISQLNQDSQISAIMVQLPMPISVDTSTVLNSIDSRKDADGLTAANLGLLFQKNPAAIASATPFGVIKLFEEYNLDLNGKNAVIIGRSPYIGLPLSALFLQKNATVTICHSYTQNLKNVCQSADILVSAVGKAKFITADMVKEGSVVVDIGLSPDPQTQKLVGDVDFENVAPKCSFITPVPGGVGPMTIACLLYNTVKIHKKTRTTIL
ncbi:MAG: bifunctional 5,10-methylenetetrahydrofolate dehydrogenase/5,10-methenyltetrahydrofolate cyclohydrolase [Candidatus Shapirobacteria bacterium]